MSARSTKPTSTDHEWVQEENNEETKAALSTRGDVLTLTGATVTTRKL